MDTLVSQDGRREERNPGSGEYFEVSTADGYYYVDYATAARISRLLDGRWPPRWVKFVDLAGARVWVRSRTIDGIRESTGRQRAADREFHYRRRKESLADRRWDDED